MVARVGPGPDRLRLTGACGAPDKGRMTGAEIDALLAAALAGPAPAGLAAVPDDAAGPVLAAADFHGVAALLHHRLGPQAPRHLREGLRARAHGEAVRTLAEQDALRHLLPALAEADARPLVFKGTALAHAVYPDPALRPRGDADILIAPGARAAADAALRALGWVQTALGPGQASYAPDGRVGPGLRIDLHWRISNSVLLAALFDHGELWRRAAPLPALQAEARGVLGVDALLIACMHRLQHAEILPNAGRVGSERLIWLHDIRLLAEGLPEEGWAERVRRARGKGLAGPCHAGLAAARDRLGARCPEAALAALAEAGEAELPARYLRAGPGRRRWMDLLAEPGAAGKLRAVRALAFPPADALRLRAGAGRGRPLAWLYAARVAGGIARRLRREPPAPGRP